MSFTASIASLSVLFGANLFVYAFHRVGSDASMPVVLVICGGKPTVSSGSRTA